MSINPSQISWGSYNQFEGPFFRGTEKFVTPPNPSWGEKVLSVVTATEGGSANAVNMYDRCILSVGLVQWCEAGQFSVSDMLGVVAHRKLDALAELVPAMKASNVEFKLNSKGRWRFHFLDTRGEVDRLQEQKELFLLDSTGLRGQWSAGAKEHAKLWAACISSVWTHADAKKAQTDFTVPKLMNFAMAPAKAILFGPGTPTENEGWTGAIRAAYLSFAANLPAVANDHIQRAAAATSAPVFSPDWCIAVLKQLTFGPQIAIYPHRYNAIRPVVERVFSVDLPDFAKELQTWREEVLTPSPAPQLTLADFDTPIEYQQELIAQGYDLGPGGADGVWGRLSKRALIQFQQVNRLTPDGIIGPKTRVAFLNAAIKRLGSP